LRRTHAWTHSACLSVWQTPDPEDPTRLVDHPAEQLTCLIQEQETLGITPVFWKDEQLSADEKPAILPTVVQ
jgi:hypothetical protein